MRSWFNFDGSVPPGTKIHKCASLCRLQLSQLAYDDGWVVICLLCGDSYPRSTKWQSCYLQSVCVSKNKIFISCFRRHDRYTCVQCYMPAQYLSPSCRWFLERQLNLIWFPIMGATYFKIYYEQKTTLYLREFTGLKRPYCSVLNQCSPCCNTDYTG